MPFVVASSTTAAASGCSDRDSALARMRITSSSPIPAQFMYSTTCGRPTVSVPVLSNATTVDRARRLERLRALDEDAARCAAARAHDDRGGRCEPERAGARDDQDRDERGERIAESGLWTEHEPRERARECDREDDRHEDRRDAVDEPLDRRLRPLRLLDETDDLRDERVAAHARRRGSGKSPCRLAFRR